MNEAMVYLSALGFAVSLLPVHIYNYIFVNTERKYASINVGAYRYITFFNANTIENKPGEMQINGKSKKLNLSAVKLNFYKIFNSLCIFKIVQLGDFGMNTEKNAYLALTQNAFTLALYKFIDLNGNYAKLKNYTILNQDHGYVRYYCKMVTIINLFVVGKILMILITEKLYGKIKKEQR